MNHILASELLVSRTFHTAAPTMTGPRVILSKDHPRARHRVSPANRDRSSAWLF